MADPRNELVRRIREGERFLVASHASPDGDALGATAAMGWLLAALGKTGTLLNDSPVPPQYAWLPLPSPLVEAPDGAPYDLAFVLDCGDAARLGRLQTALDPTRMAVIDHHLGNPEFGALNWVDPGRCAVGEMVALLAIDCGVPLTGPMAEALYTAMATDTGFFSYGSTSAACLDIVAELVRGGLDVGRIGASIKNQWTLAKARLTAEILGNLDLCRHGQVGSIRISQEMFARTGTGPEDCEGLVNYALMVRGVRAAVLARELPEGGVKFSLRSVGAVDVRTVAAAFGGGGHKNAAGGRLDKPLAEASAVLVEALGRAVEQAGDA